MRTWHDLDGERIADMVGDFSDYDGLIERLRERAASVGLSYSAIEVLADMSEGSLTKYLSDLRIKRLTVESLLRLARVLGIRGVFFIDPVLAAEMASEYGTRDARKAHARRLASVGKVTIKRLLPVVAGEYGRRGGKARMQKMTARMRRRFAKAGAAARWRKNQGER